MTGIKAKIALVLVSLLFSAVLCEIILRVFVVQETKRLASYDADIGWTGVPGGEGLYVRLKDSIEVPFRYNSLGFRDEELPSVEHPGVQLVFLGDSFVESLEVPYEESFQKRIETTLNARMDSVSVINISSQGYSTAQELLAFRKFQPLVKPDMVLLAFYTGNDFDDNKRETFAFINPQGKVEFAHPEESWMTIQFLTFKRWLYEHSHLVYFLKNTIENLSGTKIGAAAKKERDASEDYAWRITDLLLNQIHREMDGQGIPFGVVIFPSVKEIRTGDHSQTDFVAEVCRRSGIPFLRLDGSLEKDNYFVNDEHLNETGHAVAAREILHFVEGEFLGGTGEKQ